MLRAFPFLLLIFSLSAYATNHREWQFLLVSDVHFNPMADPSLVSQLVTADAADWEPILNRTTPGAFSGYGFDTNWWLLKSALKQFPRTLPHPEFVMVTGDLLAHSFLQSFRTITHDSDQRHYQAFVLKTVQFLALQLRWQFPKTRVFITPGNNDNDCGDYTIEANGAFLSDTAQVAQELAGGDQAFVSSWKSLGSFNVPHPTFAGVRIMSLNSIFLSQKYRALSSVHGCALVPSNAPSELLAWLDRSLAAAAQANQKVWLMFHIPPGIDGYASAMNHSSATDETCGNNIVPMWAPEWTAKFDALLAKYQSVVVAGFAGHTHSDDFRLIGSNGAERKFVLIDPAISPVYSQNPGFRVVKYRSGGIVTNQSTYYLTNLKSATNVSSGRWKREYTFTRTWKSHGLNAESLQNVYNEVTGNEKYQDRWLHLYAVSGPAEAGEKGIVRALYCAAAALSVDSYKSCYCSAGSVPEQPSHRTVARRGWFPITKD